MDNKKLDVINVFEKPCEIYSTRNATEAEMMEQLKNQEELTLFVKDELLKRIDTHVEAVKHILDVQVDNVLESHIDNALKNNKKLKTWEKTLPSKTPKSLVKYQKEYSKEKNNKEVDQNINQHGGLLSDGQILFHGGTFEKTTLDQFTTSKPLSTTFCPQIALRNAEFGGKAYDENEINIYVLTVKNSKTNVFKFKQNGTNFGHEKEVLFAAGADITIMNKVKICDDRKVCKCNPKSTSILEKKVSVYYTEVEIS